MNEKLLSYLKKYLTAFAVMGAVTMFVTYMRGLSDAPNAAEKYRILADSFTIPSVVILMVGVLIWVAGEGTFDMLSYGLNRGINSIIPLRQQTDENFYDYKMRKNKKRIKGYSFLFISGGIYFVPALVFNILYCFV